MTAIRRADVADVPWLLAQLRAFDTFYGLKHSLVPTDPADAAATVAQLVTTQPFFIAERSESWPVTGPHVDTTATAAHRVGFIAGVLAPHGYNASVRVLQELFWWVAPEHRGSSAGARLLAEFETYGRAHADMVVLSLAAQSPIEPAALERRGFVLHERSFLLEV